MKLKHKIQKFVNVQVQIVACSGCGVEHELSEMLSERLVDGHRDVTEVALECPSCGHHQHAYFDNGQLARRRRALAESVEQLRKNPTHSTLRNYESAKRAYKSHFDAFNAKMRASLGIVSPQELLAQEQGS